MYCDNADNFDFIGCFRFVQSQIVFGVGTLALFLIYWTTTKAYAGHWGVETYRGMHLVNRFVKIRHKHEQHFLEPIHVVTWVAV